MRSCDRGRTNMQGWVFYRLDASLLVEGSRVQGHVALTRPMLVQLGGLKFSLSESGLGRAQGWMRVIESDDHCDRGFSCFLKR